MQPISKRKKKVPLPKIQKDLKPHQLRKKELSRLQGIPEIDIFVDPVNGLELYKTPTGWATRPESWRGVSE